MDSKKLFMWPVVISLVGHVALIGASSLVDLRENVKAAEIFSVRLAPAESVEEPKQEEKKIEKQKPAPSQDVQAAQPDTGREDTVDLGSSDIKYADYLATVKKQIMRLWVTSNVYRKNDKGVVEILMSINADGSLASVSTTAASGNTDMDRQTLEVIQSAAPFKPLPQHYDLSRLHITASFRYGNTQ